MLGIILAILFFIASPWGMLTLLVGIVGYIVSPMLHRVTGIGRSLANFPLWLVGTMLGRGALVVSEHNDLLLKKMQFDDLGVEKITFGSERKEFEDPDGALHSFLGMTFSLADERHGILFDPRHAAAGRRKRQADTRGEGIVPATTEEWDDFDVVEWVRGVFSFPHRNEIIDLADVRYLVDGGERAENPRQTEEIFKHSRRPFDRGTPAMKFIYPIVALLGPFLGIWILSTQLGTSTGSVVGWGGMLWLLIGGPRPNATSVKHTAKRVALSLALLVPVALMVMTLGIMTTIIVLAVFVLGFFFIPTIALLSGVSARLSSAIAGLLLTQGLFGYDRPVLEWTPRKYRLRECSDFDDPEEVRWYNFAGSIFGVSFQPGPGAWGAEYVPHEELESRKEDIVTDGGESSVDSSIPPDCVPYNFRNRGQRGAFGPKRLKDDHYYLHSGILMQRFEDTATGEKSMRRLTNAKEKHGEGGFGLSDKSVLYATVACGILSFVGSVVVFFA